MSEPAEGTQCRTILALLRMYPSGITARDAYDHGAGMRLSGRIYDLRALGFEIEDVWETFGSARYVRYVLKEAPLQMTMELAETGDTVTA